MACDCADPRQTAGNDVSGIPIKVGQPLSTACDRANMIGSIPEVIRHPAFTLVAGGVAGHKMYEGGIENMASFFTNRKGCYGNDNGRVGGSTCE